MKSPNGPPARTNFSVCKPATSAKTVSLLTTNVPIIPKPEESAPLTVRRQRQPGRGPKPCASGNKTLLILRPFGNGRAEEEDEEDEDDEEEEDEERPSFVCFCRCRSGRVT